MKVLWIINRPLPEATSLLDGEKELKSSGGWMLGAANALMNNFDIELHIASVSPKVQELKIIQGRQITHYLFPIGKGNLKYNKQYEPYWKRIKGIVNPDVVHIHGTEFTHLLAYVKACGSSNVVVSIQGLKWVYYRYYLGGMSSSDIKKSLTIHDFLKGSLIAEQKKFKETGKSEIELIKSVEYVIGRTDWDRAHTWAINPNCQYFFCNETLRDEFYASKKWNYDECEKHSIFLSQAYYPVKGLHKAIEALPFVLRHYPDAKLKVAGVDITRTVGLMGHLRLNGYGKFLNNLIERLGLKDRIIFLGPLNAKQMVEEYLRSNLFICPSSIENSPNSLGEAQILGVPHLSSYVGGSMNMMKGNEDGLYRFEEVEMLAMKICDIFANEDKQVNMIDEAEKRHNQKENAENLMNIYKSIVSNV